VVSEGLAHSSGCTQNQSVRHLVPLN
jgi:hypothetical protein